MKCRVKVYVVIVLSLSDPDDKHITKELIIIIIYVKFTYLIIISQLLNIIIIYHHVFCTAASTKISYTPYQAKTQKEIQITIDNAGSRILVPL